MKVLVLLSTVCISWTGCAWSPKLSPKRQPDLYLVPNGYIGWLHVDYGVKGAPPLPVRWGHRVYRFSRTGKIRTSSPLLFGWAKDKIYYTTPKGWKELKGMDWGGTTSEGGITLGDGKGKMRIIPTPATSDVFISTWKQFEHRKSVAPRSKESDVALKQDY